MKVLLMLACAIFLSACPKKQPPQEPSPTPTATPSPAASASPSNACKLAPMPGNDNCPRLAKAVFLPQIEKALDQVMKEHPDYFDFKDMPIQGQPKVVKGPEYFKAVLESLRAQGLCADADENNEEVAVKNSNSFNEQYDLYRGAGYVRRGMGAYLMTCTPSAF